LVPQPSSFGDILSSRVVWITDEGIPKQQIIKNSESILKRRFPQEPIQSSQELGKNQGKF
jgi:hypothetical protein